MTTLTAPTSTTTVAAAEPRWWRQVGSARGGVLRFGQPVVDVDGHRLGRLEAVGIDTAGVVTTLATADVVYPAAAVRELSEDRVVVDPAPRALVRVVRELHPATPVWCTDDTELRLHGIAVGGDGRRIEGVLVARPREAGVVVPWDVVRPEPEGVALAMYWPVSHPPLSVWLVRRLAPTPA